MACPGCLEGCDERFEALTEQPKSTEMTIDGAFVKTFVLPIEGSLVPQHAHRTAHMTAVVRGSIRVWVAGKLGRIYRAPQGVVIPANVLHHFRTLEPDTVLMCIHGYQVEQTAENSMPGGA